MNPDKCALIIPSSVHVGARYTSLVDPVLREMQYIDALTFFIRETILSSIIVCDNSGYRYPGSLHDLAVTHNKQIELLSFTGDREKLKSQGKGYGEGEIMEYVMTHSLLLGEVDGFLKVTGRLKVVNIDRVLQRIKSTENYFMPVSLLRPRFLVPRAARPCVEVRVYYATKPFFNNVLLHAYKEVSDDKVFFMEHAYYRAISEFYKRSSGSPSPFPWRSASATPPSSPPTVSTVPPQNFGAVRVKCFPEAPEITGMSGSNGWVFRERSAAKKILIKIVAKLGYVRPV